MNHHRAIIDRLSVCCYRPTQEKTFHWGLLIIINAIRALTSHNRRSKLHHNHILYPHDDVPTELESLCSSTFTHGQSTFLLLKHFGQLSGWVASRLTRGGGWQSTDSLFTRLDKPCIIISTHSFCFCCYYTKHNRYSCKLLLRFPFGVGVDLIT